MNEDKLKRRVSKRIPSTELWWDLFLDKGYVEDALGKDNYKDAVDFIIEEYYKHKAAFAETGGRRRPPDQERSEVPVSLSGSAAEREAAFEELAAKRATCDDGVRWFRERVLEGRLLTAGQARELVRSPAARFLEANKFKFAGGDVPLVGHRATLEGYERMKGSDWAVRHRAIVSVDPPGMTETVEDTFYDPPRLAPKRPRYKDGTDGQALYYVNERGRPRYVSVWDRSVLEELRDLSERLAQWYRWEPAQATMFVLAGVTPNVPSLKVGTSVRLSRQLYPIKTASSEYIDARVIIEVSPWVSSETVKKAYRKAQIKVMGTSGGKAPGSKSLKLYRFVTERVGPTCTPDSKKMPNGKSLMSEWNDANPQWKAYKDTRRFWRDYNRIRRTIAVGPPYQTHHAASDHRSRQADGSS